MKKIMKLFIFTCALLLQVQIAMASSSEVWRAEDADLAAIRRIVVCEALYTPNEGADITDEAILAMISEQGQRLGLDTVTKKVIERSISSATGVDLLAMQDVDSKQADELFYQELPKFVDAYMKVTVIHNSRIVFFYDIYDAKTAKRIYGAQVMASRNMPDTMETYALVTKRFYREFLSDIKEQKKK